MIVAFTSATITEDDIIKEIGEQLLQLMQENQIGRLVLDFGAVKQCGSSMIATVVRIDQRLKTNGGQFAVCGLDTCLREIFSRTRLDRIVQIYKQEQQCLNAFQN